MTDAREQALSPTTFTPAAITVTPEDSRSSPVTRGWLWLGVFGIALLFGVVVLLPQWVGGTSSSKVSTTIASDDVSARDAALSTDARETTQVGSSAETNSPFAEAQLSRARREAQDILQPLLDLQAYLQSRGVTDWAPDPYNEALGFAATGDAAYREQAFVAAISAYQSALVTLQSLEQRLPDEVTKRIDAVTKALERYDPTAANEHLAALQVMAPAQSETDALAARVTALPDVMTALEGAALAAASDDFEAAVAGAQSAVSADPLHVSARAQLAAYQERKQQRDFQLAMSEGYVALSNNAFASAKAQFEYAQSLSPNAIEPADALLEVESTQTAYQLNVLRDEATVLEDNEQWQAALDRYLSAIDTDATLVFAADGITRVRPRAELAAAVEAIITAPERLVDPIVLGEAEQTLRTLEGMSDTGPRHQQTVSALRATLARATTPVKVDLRSDSLTDVTLARVKRLGVFSQQTLSLRPGSYTAVGVRNGYRDVRVSFVVTPEVATQVISVICQEAL